MVRVWHAERLRVPWWLELCAIGAAGVVATELSLAAPERLRWLPYLLLIPATAAGLWLLGRLRVAVVDDELHVDDAALPVRFVSGVTVLGPDEKRLLLGPMAHPYAFVVQRPWLRGALQVHLDDADDPTPYWVVSSRRPAALAEAVLAARHEYSDRGGSPRPDSPSRAG